MSVFETIPNRSRELVLRGLDSFSGANIVAKARFLELHGKQSKEHVQATQRKRLTRMLKFAVQNIPYYKKAFSGYSLFTGDSVDISVFEKLPLLTKHDIQNQQKALQSPNLKSGTYTNSSGGSTGKPAAFLQDREYYRWNVANKIYFKQLGGQRLGDRELRLWGSEADVLAGRESALKRMQSWIYNRREVNTFYWDTAAMDEAISLLADWRPTWVEAYVQSAVSLAAELKKRDISISGPKGLVVTAGTLYGHWQKELEAVFHCPVYNRYGSREVGDMAFTCPCGNHMLLSAWHHYIELLDDENKPVAPGQVGRVVVTTLTNRAMPLIRYDIGDVAQAAMPDQVCDEYGWPAIATVKGREVGIFKTAGGVRIDGEYFTHLMYYQDWCRQFQFRQVSHTKIEVLVVVADGKTKDFQEAKATITTNIKKVMGQNTEVAFKVVDHIPALPSGKYMYCISEVDE